MSREDARQALDKALACDIRYLDPSNLNAGAF